MIMSYTPQNSSIDKCSFIYRLILYKDFFSVLVCSMVYCLLFNSGVTAMFNKE